MWGPGAGQGGILQTSSCKFDLKEPYYRMSQPQPYSNTQDQSAHNLLNTQVMRYPSGPSHRVMICMIWVVNKITCPHAILKNT